MSTKTKTACILLPLFIALILFGSKILIWCFMSTMITMSLAEFYRMTLPPEKNFLRYTGLAVAVSWLGVAYVDHGLTYLYPFMTASLILLSILSILHEDVTPENMKHLAMTFLGIFYIAFLGSNITRLKDLEILEVAHGVASNHWLFYAFLLTWMGDSGAYFCGKRLGRHKIIKKVSPNKTLEGFIGGFAATLLVSIIASQTFVPRLSLADGALLGIIVGIVGPFGDLIESFIKRGAGVKDSGQFMPGHGGFFDRTDSVLFTTSAVFYYVSYCIR
jgi:phosphatidate cytidylyltransferase